MFQFEKVVGFHPKNCSKQHQKQNRKRNRGRCLFRSRFRFKGYLHVSLSCLVKPEKPAEKIQRFHLLFRGRSGHLKNQLQKKRTTLSFKETLRV